MKYFRFQSYHPYVSFTGNSTTFLSANGDSPGWRACDTKANDDALELWQLGKRAFHGLQEFESAEHFDRTYCEYQEGVQMYANVLQENAHKFKFTGKSTGNVFTPIFSEYESGYQILDVFWQLYEARGGNAEHLAAYFLFACLQEIDAALIQLCLDGGAAESIVAATLSFERVQSINSESVRIQRGRSEFSALGATERHKRDPKQTEKSFVRECWRAWQGKPSQYKGKAKFARAMLDKCENLESQKVIEDWCRAWEIEARTGTMPAE